jgi:hypothetical protein
MEPSTDDDINGQQIVNVREMTDEELEREGWQHYRGQSPAVLVLESGTIIYASADPEGNGPGAMFGIDEDGSTFALYP